MTTALDRQALGRWLQNHFPRPDAGLKVEPISGGQSNPTFFVDWGGDRMVLRKKPSGLILPGAHAVEREFRVLAALTDTAVPVPRPLKLEEDPTVLGTPFYLMERLDGRVFSEASLPGVAPGDRRAMYFAMAETLATLHRVVPGDVGLGDFGRPGNYFERQIARWSRQYHDSAGPRIAALDRLLDWLPAHVPPDDGDCAIAHGDFRLGNLMFHPTKPKVIAVLDWELATLGHPLADLGFCVMPWHSAPDEYGGILGLDLKALGLPARAEFLDRYLTAARPTAPLQPFHLSFALFRFAVIFVGIADRARTGSAASDEAARLAPLAESFANRALQAAGLSE